ncbi:MAG: DNA repair protein RecO [Oscillospiraceae bacterium]|jgi:DNA repair protein RecO (recombination protein O)|nr:DNA repair protein RecO [Oscillospiraceae bacterium]
MEFLNTPALVLRSAPYRESSRMLTVLTAEYGRLSVAAHSTSSKKNSFAAASEPLVFSDFTLERRGERYTLREAQITEQFRGLTESLESFSLGCYIAELCENVADADTAQPELLSLALNALFALAEGKRPRALVKAATELRLMCIAGYEPPPGNTLGDAPLDGDAASAARFVVTCELRRLYSFKLENTRAFAAACESYVTSQLERGFKTLDYYKLTETPER